VALRWVELNEDQDRVVLTRLGRILEDRSPVVRVQALLTLGKVGPRSGVVPLEQLQIAIKDRDGLARAAAVEALGRFGARAEKAIASLQRAVKDQDGVVRRHAVKSLGEIGTAALPALKDKDQEVAAAAADAIKKVETGKSE